MERKDEKLSAQQLRRRPSLRVEAPGPDRRAAARALYEGTPGATLAWVSKETGVPLSTLKDWVRWDEWRPATKRLPDLSARAGMLADSFKTKMSELGKPLDDSVAAAEASRELADGFAVDVRAQVLDRHRKEWAAPRKLAYEAVQKRDFELAKLAKITSETLTLVQGGECKAYGINHEARAADARTVVVVDRSASDAEVVDAVAPGGAGAEVAPSPETSTAGDTATGDADDDEDKF